MAAPIVTPSPAAPAAVTMSRVVVENGADALAECADAFAELRILARHIHADNTDRPAEVCLADAKALASGIKRIAETMSGYADDEAASLRDTLTAATSSI